MSPYTSPDVLANPLLETNLRMLYVGRHVGDTATLAAAVPAVEATPAEVPEDFSALRAGLAAAKADLDAYFAEPVPYAPAVGIYSQPLYVG